MPQRLRLNSSNCQVCYFHSDAIVSQSVSFRCLFLAHFLELSRNKFFPVQFHGFGDILGGLATPEMFCSIQTVTKTTLRNDGGSPRDTAGVWPLDREIGHFRDRELLIERSHGLPEPPPKNWVQKNHNTERVPIFRAIESILTTLWMFEISVENWTNFIKFAIYSLIIERSDGSPRPLKQIWVQKNHNTERVPIFREIA